MNLEKIRELSMKGRWREKEIVSEEKRAHPGNKRIIGGRRWGGSWDRGEDWGVKRMEGGVEKERETSLREEANFGGEKSKIKYKRELEIDPKTHKGK